jgi:hypothetical protein
VNNTTEAESHKAWLQKVAECAESDSRRAIKEAVDLCQRLPRYESFVERVLKADHECLGKFVWQQY